MNKKLIRLTEGDLHRIVKESVNRVLNEIGDTPKGQLALGAVAGRANVRGNRNTEIAASNKAWDNSASGKVRGTHYDSGYELGKDMERDKQQKQYIASRLKEDVIKESVKRVLSELDWKTYANAANKANQRKDSRYNKFFSQAADEFNKEYGYSDEDGYVEYDGMNLRAKNNDYPSHSLMRRYDYDPETGEYSNPYNYDDGRAMGLDSFMGDRYPRYKNPSLKKFFDNLEQEKAYKRASDEMDKYKLGKSKYVKGQGWQ